jgi:hypothetical protein
MLCSILLTGLSPARGTIMQFEAFAGSGKNWDVPGLDLYAEIVDSGDQVSFVLHNESTISSSIKGIYFEDGVLDGIVGIDFSSEAQFVANARPSNLPARNELEPSFVTAYSAGAESPARRNVLDPGEELTVILGLDGGATFSDLMDQLHNGTVRIGLHVIKLPNASNCSAVNTIVNPEPCTILLLGLGAVMLKRQSG